LQTTDAPLQSQSAIRKGASGRKRKENSGGKSGFRLLCQCGDNIGGRWNESARQFKIPGANFIGEAATAMLPDSEQRPQRRIKSLESSADL
jgi:hypothetical protein